MSKILRDHDVRRLLRDEVMRAGGQSAWARREKVSRPNLNKMLAGQRPMTPTILKKLKLETVYILKR